MRQAVILFSLLYICELEVCYIVDADAHQYHLVIRARHLLKSLMNSSKPPSTVIEDISKRSARMVRLSVDESIA